MDDDPIFDQSRFGRRFGFGDKRALSVSVPGGKYPGPEAVNMIAKLFGFTPDINKWMRHINQEDRCIVVVEPLGSDLTSVKLS